MDKDYSIIRKSLVSLAIEQTLIEIGGHTLETVTRRLFEKYHCYLPDCYETPEYLKEILKELFEDSYSEIIGSIKTRLDEFSSEVHIAEFLLQLTKNS